MGQEVLLVPHQDSGCFCNVHFERNSDFSNRCFVCQRDRVSLLFFALAICKFSSKIFDFENLLEENVVWVFVH